MDFDVTIEIPKGGRNKYEFDHVTVASGWTGPCSPPLSTPPTTASSTTASARTATRSTRWSSSRSPPSQAA